ncbi:LIM domain kinase 2-like [Lineus longissimus]|uniref:LIM domain kinase 2-like n=1 Tax=Lineus longissimus TaxID=88925 RepID=UPI00315DF27A
MATKAASRCIKCNACADQATDDNVADTVNKLHRYGICGHVMCLDCIKSVGIDVSSSQYEIATSNEQESNPNDACPDSRATDEPSVNLRRIPTNADCPVCQKHALLFPSPGNENHFPSYLKKFSIVKKAMEQQVPKLCDNCKELAATPTSQCIDCETYLCDKCCNSHGTGKEFQHRLFKLKELEMGSLFKPLGMKLVSVKDPTLCQRHYGTLLSAWCYTCGKALCLQCKRHHIDHQMGPIENHLKNADDAIKESRAAAENLFGKLLHAESTHAVKKVSVESLSANVKSAILKIAEERKRAIDEDAGKLVQAVEQFVDEFNATSGMLTEMTECEKTSFHMWNKIYDAMSTETGDIKDEYLLDFHEFLAANDDVIKGQKEVVNQIAEGFETLLERFIEFEENDVVPGNQVGSISQPVTSSASQPASASDETCSSPPVSSTFDDLDQGLFNIEETELWHSQKIDKGPSFTIYKGVYKTQGINLPVAIKELDEEASKSELDSFINEAKTLRDLDHKNIVKLVGVCRSNTLFLVTELASLGSMGKYLKSHPLTPLIDLYELLHQVTEGMKYLESLHIIHRCLTARTIYLDTPRHARIGSFGLAKRLDNQENFFTEKATRRYPLKWYPPESVYKFEFDAKCDVWSYGVVMWEVFSYGIKPYKNMKGPEILTMLDIGERLYRPDRCPKPAYDVMRLCWAASRGERPTFERLEIEIKEILKNEISDKTSEVYVLYDPQQDETEAGQRETRTM